MLKNVLRLTRVMLTNSGEMFRIKLGKSNSTKPTIILWLLTGLCFIPLIGMLYSFYNGIYQSFLSINQVDLLTVSIVNIMKMVIFIFSLFTMPAIFYFSKDIEYLLPLPLRDIEIISARFIITMIYEYLMLALFMLPYYAVLIQHSSPLFIPAGLVVFLMLPVTPLCYSSVIVITVMSFSHLSKNKELFSTIAGVLGVLLGAGFGIFSQRMMTNINIDDITQTILRGESIINDLVYLFPDSKPSASAISEINYTGLLISVALAVAIYCAFLFLAKLLYFKGVMSITGSRKSGKRLTAENISAHSGLHNIFYTYVIKEIKLLFRSSVTFINCIMMELLFPLMLFIPMFSSPDTFNELKKLDLSGGKTAVIVLIIASALGMFCGAINLVSATAISREGSGYIFLKYIPVSYMTQINAKVFSGLLIGGVGSALFLFSSYLLVTPPVHLLISGFILGLLGSVFMNYLGILLDLTHPKLSWDSEQQAVKQNLNVAIMTLISFVLILGITVPFALFFDNALTAGILLLVVFTAADILVYKIVMRFSTRLMDHL